jgi:dGTPase
MPCTRVELEERERSILAPYAQLSADSRGRKYHEDPPEWRTQYQRDRDRVIHSRAFRRLEYKTQVFLNGTGDHLRTRLTHTMEVAGISRNIARALRLNEDLTEAIALAHDLGHSPFGHKGESVLNQLMKDHGGFEHNRQSLRVVELLEQKYLGFPGLNLTWELREGLSKHAAPPPGKKVHGFKSHSLEAQVANIADEIAYYSHDLDDGLSSSLLVESRLEQDIQIWAEAAHGVPSDRGQLPDESRRYFVIRCIIDSQVRDVVHTTEKNLDRAGVKHADDVRRYPKPLVEYSPARRKLNLELRRYLYKNLYFNPVVHDPNQQAGRLLEKMFHHFSKRPGDFSELARSRARKDGWPRVICDYLAGMTDRYAIREHARLFGKSAMVRPEPSARTVRGD